MNMIIKMLSLLLLLLLFLEPGEAAANSSEYELNTVIKHRETRQACFHPNRTFGVRFPKTGSFAGTD